MNQEPTIQSRRIFEGKILSLRVDTVGLSQGRTSTREIVEHGPAVAIVPLDESMNVLLVRQYRKAVDQALLEVPAGGMEDGEEPEVCARRELEEETGYSASRWERLGSFFTTPGFSDEEMHTFLATELTPGESHPDEDEVIEPVTVPLTSVRELIEKGEIRDAKTITSLLLVLERTGRDR